MGAFTAVILRLRLPILVLVTVVTGLLAYRLPELEQDEDVLQFLPAEDPDIRLFRQVSREFGGLDVAIIGVESPRLLTHDGLVIVRRIARAAANVDGVYHTVAFTELPHLTPTESEFAIDPLVPEEIPTDPDAIATIRQNILNDAIVAGRQVSRDGTAAQIYCFLSSDAEQSAVARAIEAAVRPVAGHVTLHFGGLPFVQSYIGGGTRADIVHLTPYVLLLAALATFIFFRKPLGSLLVLTSVALGTIWTIGGMAVLGAQMTIISTSLPMVLVAIGGAYGAHVLAAYYVAKAPTAAERVEKALREVGPPVVASMMTTVAGFASFLAMDVAPMRSFGFQASVGVFLCGLLAMVVVPSVLSFGKGKPEPPPAERLGPPIVRYALGARRRRWLTLGLTVAVCAVAGAAAWRVAPDTSMDSFFRPDSGPARADQFLRDRFGGSVFVQVYMRADLSDPVVLDELRAIVEEARTLEGVTDVNSHLQTLETLAAGLGGVPRIPQSQEQVAGLRAFMAGNPGLRQLVDDDMTRAIVLVTVGTQDTRIVNAVVDRLREFIATEIPDHVVSVDIFSHSTRVEAARDRRLKAVSARAARLLRARGFETNDDANDAIYRVLKRRYGAWTLEAGADLDREVSAAVSAFFTSDDSPFDPFDASGASSAVARIATRPITNERLAEVLPGALPAELAEDAEGVEMAVPSLRDRVAEARSRVLAKRFAPEVIRAAGSSEPTEAMVTDVERALQELDDARVGLPSDGEGLAIDTGVTGTPVINRAFGASTQRNQIRSIVISFLALLALGFAMFRSGKLGVLAVLPAGVTLLVTFGLMGWLNVPLDPGTCMVAALALGIGIDYSIHFIWRRRWRGLSLEETSRTVGPAILFNAVQVAVGFAVMIVADTVPLSRFGTLVTVAMLVSAVATFTILPAFERADSGAEPPAEP